MRTDAEGRWPRAAGSRDKCRTPRMPSAPSSWEGGQTDSPSQPPPSWLQASGLQNRETMSFLF